MRQVIVSTLTSLTLLTGLTFTPSMTHAAAATSSSAARGVIVEGVHRSDHGELAVKIVRTARGQLRGRITLTDPATSTRLVLIIRDQVVYARGLARGESVRETHALAELFDLDLSGEAPVLRPAKRPKLKCPGGFVGWLVCEVAMQIAIACLDDGEFLGVKCGSSDDDGGGTTGGSDDSGTSTTG